MLAGIGAWFAANALKLGAVLLAIIAIVTYIDRKATYRERAKWEQRVEEAKQRVREQDQLAHKKATENQKTTIDALSSQKVFDDAEIARLRSEIAKRPVSKQCIATAEDADPVPARRRSRKPLSLLHFRK